MHGRYLLINLENVNIRKWSQSSCPVLMVLSAVFLLPKDGFASCFHVSFSISSFAILISTALSFSGVDGALKVGEVEMGSLSSSDQLGKSELGKLMCNTLLCPNSCCQGATEQGTCCFSGCSQTQATLS